MGQDRSSIYSSNQAVDVLIDYTKKLYPVEKTKGLDSIADETQKIHALHEIIFGRNSLKHQDDSQIDILMEKMRNRLSDVAARKYIEEGIKKEVIDLMQKREKEYLEEMKLQVLKKHTGVENATTLKKFAELEKMKNIKLSKTILDVMRPKIQDEIIGQQDSVSSLISKIASPFPQHVILYGPPGVGKTTAARIALSIAKTKAFTPFLENAKFVEVDATTLRWDPRESVNPLLGSVHDPIYQGAKKELAELGVPEPKPGLVTEAHGGVLFIDEIGELDIMFQNKLLKVLEDKKVNFDSSYYDVNNDGVPLYIKKLFEEGAPADFVLIGATTRSPEEINPALRSRCAEIYFNPLDSTDITQIVQNSAEKLDVKISSEDAAYISSYTYEARKAVNILADCYSNAVSKSGTSTGIEITSETVKEVISKSRLVTVNKNKSSQELETGKINGLGVNGYLGSVLELEAVCFDREDEGGKVALMNIPARMDTCITGEISIRGNIKAVGGIREKVFAAKRHGFQNVIIPEENREDAIGMDGINIITAGNIQEVIDFIFEQAKQ
ncbi:MAG: ATP-dependent protease, Lon family [Clostridia bacterium]|nr:ATP-dependent protease, Lon family [Clostridia bacterium]